MALAAPAKLQLLAKLLDAHRNDRVLIFTYDNATVYQIARQYLVPAIKATLRRTAKKARTAKT